MFVFRGLDMAMALSVRAFEPSRPTGDIANATGKLASVLSRDPFRSVAPVVKQLGNGSDPVPILRILHTCALHASPVLTAFLMKSASQSIISATDTKFVDEMYVAASRNFWHADARTEAGSPPFLSLPLSHTQTFVA